ncbi:MAG: VWA domain-containing protein [Pirellulales bacterium]
MSGVEELWAAKLWAAWTFASASLLGWGVAALIPLAIHLWARRRYQEQAWAAMAFLLAALRRHSRRLWMEQWLLLSLRIAALLVLAVALADLASDGESAATTAVGEEASTHWILVVDVSYSMDARRGERSRLDELRDRLAALVREARQGDGFSLVLLADPPQTVIEQPTFDAAAVLEELQELRVAHGGADLRGALQAVERVVSSSQSLAARFPRRRIVIGTDLGRTTWRVALDDDVIPSWARLTENAQASLIDVGSEETANLAVTSLVSSEGLVTLGRNVRIEAVVRNFGDREVRGATVEFASRGRSLGSQSIDVPAGGQATASISTPFMTPGDQLVSVALRPDALPLDNRRWLSLPVRERQRVLCIEGRLEEARFLALALDPLGGERSPASIELASESALLERSLRGFDLVCVCNVARFARAEADALRAYVQDGGQLAVFLGDQVQVEAYNAELGGESPRRLLPARLSSPVTRADLTIDPLDYRDPLAAPFRGQERTGLLSTPVWTYIPAQIAGSAAPAVAESSAARTALAFGDGNPWVVHERRGKGRVWLITTDASGQSLDRQSTPPQPWTAWPTWPSFVPLVQGLLRESLLDRQQLRNGLVGEPLSGFFPQTAAQTEVVWQREEAVSGGGMGAAAEPPVRLATQTVDGGLAWTMDETPEAGGFFIRAGAEAPAQWAAVNLDARESDLERWDATQLPESLRREPGAQDEGRAMVRDAAGGRRWFRVLLAGLFALLVCESCLAWWLGWRTTRRLEPALVGSRGGAAP